MRVTLPAGGAGAAGRLQFTCSEQHVQLRLADGRVWASRLFAPVLPDGSDYQLKPGGRIVIRLLKHDPALPWHSLEVRGGTGLGRRGGRGNKVQQDMNDLK